MAGMARSLLSIHWLLTAVVEEGAAIQRLPTARAGDPAAEVVAELVIRLVVLAIRATPVVEE